MEPEDIQSARDRVLDEMRREYEALTPAREKMEKTIAAAKAEYETALKKYRKENRIPKEPQCSRCQLMEYIFQGKTQKERNNIAGLIHDAVLKFGCGAFVRRADLV